MLSDSREPSASRAPCPHSFSSSSQRLQNIRGAKAVACRVCTAGWPPRRLQPPGVWRNQNTTHSYGQKGSLANLNGKKLLDGGRRTVKTTTHRKGTGMRRAFSEEPYLHGSGGFTWVPWICFCHRFPYQKQQHILSGLPFLVRCTQTH